MEKDRSNGYFMVVELNLEGHRGGIYVREFFARIVARIESRYDRSNGPMIYQIQREISSISHGDMTLTSYLTKVKKLWNELFCLAAPPKCTCGINKAISEMYNSTQLLQFLMGLHEMFDKEKSQLLMMDPLPDLEKTFAMIFAVE
ncbi:UNVERIFIED_CONTAM: hypothetical protein Sindi_0912300 [Sesamum indicum]